MGREDLLRRLTGFSTADLADAALAPLSVRGVRRYAGAGVSTGFATTVRAVPGDARGVHEAVLRAEPGSVVVADFGGPQVPAAGLGELVCAEAARRGVAAVVFWGPMRDLAQIRAIGLTVVATGTEPMPGIHQVPGEQRVPVEVGGAPVAEGDLVLVDDDGVVVVPAEQVEDAVARAEQVRALDRGIAAAVLAGTPLGEHPDYRAYVAAVDERRA